MLTGGDTEKPQTEELQWRRGEARRRFLVSGCLGLLGLGWRFFLGRLGHGFQIGDNQFGCVNFGAILVVA